MKRITRTLFVVITSFYLLADLMLFICSFQPVRQQIYLDYLPERIIVPQYDITTGNVTNADEVILWSPYDYAPKFNAFIETVCQSKFVSNGNMLLIFMILFLVILPIYVYTDEEKSKIKLTIIYYLLLLWYPIQILISLLLYHFFQIK